MAALRLGTRRACRGSQAAERNFNLGRHPQPSRPRRRPPQRRPGRRPPDPACRRTAVGVFGRQGSRRRRLGAPLRAQHGATPPVASFPSHKSRIWKMVNLELQAGSRARASSSGEVARSTVRFAPNAQRHSKELSRLSVTGREASPPEPKETSSISGVGTKVRAVRRAAAKEGRAGVASLRLSGERSHF